MMRPYLLAGALAALMATAVGGYWRGYRAANAEYAAKLLEAQKEQMRVAEENSRIEQERLALQAVIDAQAQMLEDAAYAPDPDDAPVGLPAGRVRRLNQR